MDEQRLGGQAVANLAARTPALDTLPPRHRCGLPYSKTRASSLLERVLPVQPLWMSGTTRFGGPGLVLFMCVFTSQAAVLVLSPVLVKVAQDLDVSTALAGQLRIFAAPVAAVVAVLLARFGGAASLRSILLASTALVAVGAVASAAAQSFVALAVGQLPLWIGVAGLVAGGIGAAGVWSTPATRTRVVARALAGAPAAWVVGMPLIGLLAERSWRFAFLAVPLPAAILTGALVLLTRPSESRRGPASLPALLRMSGATSWVLAELLAMSAWAGTLVFSGALFVETYGTSTEVTGLLLAALAVAYLGGNALGGRIGGDCRLRRTLARANLIAAAAIAATWILTPNVFVTLIFFASASAVVAARTVVGTAYGFALAGEHRLEVGAARATVTHAGYLVGSLVGGAAFALGSRAAVGVVFASLFLIAAAPYRSMLATRCASA
jgi:DHA1 family inner membrane transport protein